MGIHALYLGDSFLNRNNGLSGISFVTSTALLHVQVYMHIGSKTQTLPDGL